MSSPVAANIVDAAALADELARFRVVDPTRLTELLTDFHDGGPAALIEHLVRRGALTPFQAERVLAGETRLLVLGPYRLTGTRGPGTFGPLFAAVHTSKPGAFNVRVLPLRSLWKARQAKQLARALAARITHSAVPPLIDADSANGFHYLAWPDVVDARLADLVGSSGPLSTGTAAALLGHLASALAACHACGVTHGAITPYSVAVALGGRPRLLELGAGALLAQNVADDESLFDSLSAAAASAIVLTFGAPELTASDQVSPTADQYALGAVGYFAVTGLPPYPHPTLAEQLRAKRAGPPPSAAIVNPAVPTELAACFDRMMAPDPADRFATLRDVEERLAALATAEAAPAPVVELLTLSDPRAGTGGSRSGTVRPAERDNSAASVTFDLPEPPETLLNTPVLESGGPVNRGAFETPPGVPFAARLPPAEPVENADQPPSGDAFPVVDPRLPAPVPVHWHRPAPNEPVAGDAAATDRPANAALWKKVKRNLLFWQAATDTVAISVFGPPAVAPGQTVDLTVFLHRPGADANVRTISRVFNNNAELISTGYLIREVPRAAELAVHMWVTNAAVAKALFKFPWRGQPHRIGFELHVPWESPEGPSPGLVSVGWNNVRIGRIEFRLNVLAHKA